MSEVTTTSSLKVIAINIAVFAALLVAVELASWTVLAVHQWSVNARVQKTTAQAAQAAGANVNTTARHGLSPEVQTDLSKWEANSPGLYRYEPYLGYIIQEHHSRYVNVTAQGYRLNRRPSNDAAVKPDIVIWMSGSSALFWVANGDSETVPAILNGTWTVSFRRTIFVLSTLVWSDTLCYRII